MGAIGLYFSKSCSNFFSRAIDNRLKTIQTNKNLDRYIDRLSADSRPIYQKAIFWLSTKCRLTINRVSTNYWAIHRSSIDQLLAKCRRSVGERKAISAKTHLEWLLTVSRASVDRLSTTISTDCRPSVDRVSTECRPTIDRVSTAILTDISVDITHSKQDPDFLGWLAN